MSKNSPTDTWKGCIYAIPIGVCILGALVIVSIPTYTSRERATDYVLSFLQK